MIEDDSFQVPSSANKNALETANSLLRWCQENSEEDMLKKFVNTLILHLKSCFSKKFSSLKLRREKMWEAYHQLRTSHMFQQSWVEFIPLAVQRTAEPAFYQHITHLIFKVLIEREFSPPERMDETTEHPDRPLSAVEENALRYVAGYVLRNVKDKVGSKSLPFKEHMLDCIYHLAGDEEDECAGTELWLNTIDRGGLWHVSDATFSLFVIMEQQSRRYFSVNKQSGMQKDSIVESLITDGDILFQWCLLTSASAIEREAATALLKHILRLYVTLRGFAFATSCLEMYKQATKKNLQKKKALRRELNHPDC